VTSYSSTSVAAIFDLTGRVAIVIGGAAGLGRASAIALAAAGAEVILADVPNRRALMEALVADGDGRVVAATVDVTSEYSVAALAAHVAHSHDGIDILVNATVLHHNRPTLEIELAEWDRVQAINLRAAFLTTRSFVPLMRRRGGGRIINVTTIGGRHPVLHGNGAYSAARAGLNQFTLNCALDFAADGITANAILPGAILTEAVDPGIARSGPGADRARQIGGFGRPDDVAGLVLLLAGPSGRYISGQQIAVDGGFLVS
jgi:NAD(P)-dependent dehydrogenase (short-subunit alcohol dehydrogenase family)